jgi:fatty-acyl-CoA synthase
VHPGIFAAKEPDRPAIVMGDSGAVVTYAELEARSNRVARLARDCGLKPGDGLAAIVENRPEMLELAWGAQRSGLQFTAVNRHLTAEEAGYIVSDCGARLLVTTSSLAGLAAGLAGPALDGPARPPGSGPAGDAGGPPGPARRLMIGGTIPGWESYEDAVAGLAPDPIPDECEGDFMLYSSGTTGRPKGIRRPVTGVPLGEYPDHPGHWLRELLGLREGDVYLSPAPLYHAAPLAWSMGCHRSGATVVVMERFDAEQALRLIERYRVTHSQWVPTMFVRLLKLPDATRSRYDLSSLRSAVHAAAPCPVPVKQAMIGWWGPVLFEYYSMTEGFGTSAITSQEWLRKPGSVGRPLMGAPHVLDDGGRELLAGEPGVIWFEGGSPSQYHSDPGKTAAATNARGWRTVGDVGYLDEDGYLFLTDRASRLIISGGVNIYPQEIENLLVLHPEVLDAAVLGVPDPEMGEQVKAVIQPADPETGGQAATFQALAVRLAAYCREHLAGFKCPRSFEFTSQELRTPVGKIRQGPLREQFGARPGPYHAAPE